MMMDELDEFYSRLGWEGVLIKLARELSQIIDEEEVKRKSKLIKKADPEFIKELVKKYLIDTIDLEQLEQKGEIIHTLLEYFPDVKLTKIKPFHTHSQERIYTPECSSECLYAKKSSVIPVGYEIKTPVSLFRIEGCYGEIKRCRKKFVQVAYKGIRPGKGAAYDNEERENCWYGKAFETGWKVLHGKLEFDEEVRDYLKELMLFGIEKTLDIEVLGRLEIPEKAEIISEVFDEDRIPGIFLYPIKLTEFCEPNTEMVWKNNSLCWITFHFFKRYYPGYLKYNFSLEIMKDRKFSYVYTSCMVNNCVCGFSGYIPDIDYDKISLEEEGMLERITSIYSLSLTKLHKSKLGYKSDKEAIKNSLNIFKRVF